MRVTTTSSIIYRYKAQFIPFTSIYFIIWILSTRLIWALQFWIWILFIWIFILLGRLVDISSSLFCVWVSIPLVFKCWAGYVPKAGSNSLWCPSDPCPSKLWQKELLFSHRPGGLCPLGDASPRDWQFRKHSPGVTEWELTAATPASRLSPSSSSSLSFSRLLISVCLSVMTWSTLGLPTPPLPITLTWRSGSEATCVEASLLLTLLHPFHQLTMKQPPPQTALSSMIFNTFSIFLGALY